MKKPLLITTLLFFLCAVIQAQTVYEVSTFAGSGVSGSQNGVGTAATFNNPYGICTDPTGNIYVSDFYNNKIRKISPSGQVSTFAGSGVAGSDDGLGSAASFKNPMGLCSDTSGNIYVADRGNYKIRKISPEGQVTTLAGSGTIGRADGLGISASFAFPLALCSDTFGNIFVTDVDNDVIRKISPAGLVTTFAGTGEPGNNDGVGTAASFNRPSGLCTDAAGNIYVADSYNNKIRKISPNRQVTTFAGSGASGSADGPGNSASFYLPHSVCADADGNIYVTAYHRIRKISPEGEVATIAGSGERGSIDGVGAAASFHQSYGICMDADGNIYVADNRNNKIRKITPKAPAPPVVSYVDLSGSICMGSTLNKTPAVTGSEFHYDFISNTVSTSPVKGMCKGNDGDFFVLYEGDSIVQYDITGTRIMRYDENATLSNIRNIAADANDKVYAFSDGINTNAIHRIGSDGWVEFGGFITPDNYFTAVSDMKLGKDGYLYVADTINGGIYKVDPASSVITTYAGPFENAAGVNKMSFGKDELYIFKKSEQKFYSRELSSSGNFTEVFHGLDTLDLAIDGFEYDTTSIGSIYISSSSKSKVYRFINSEYRYTFDLQTSCFDYTSYNPMSQPLAFVNLLNTAGTAEVLWVATGNDKLVSMSLSAFSISPPLPQGLSFDVLRGKITGMPVSAAPATTYTITVYNVDFGTTSHTINFSVDPPGAVSNALGESSSFSKHSDGLKINYYNDNNCEEIMSIEDEKGGTIIGDVEVKQEVLPTLASFASGSFVRRVTEINTQNPDAEARLKLYFTYQDIEHYNQTNGPLDPDLSNDIVGGTMQVAVLQLHKDDKGVTEQIKHNPITANWDDPKQLWVVEFPITKFSTFYMGESSSIGGFDCSSTGPTTTVSSCGFHVWRGKAYTQTGIYKDTTANQFGCDSILTLDLTVSNDFEITQDEWLPEYMSCNTAGATYQWINCNNGGTIIDGATNQDFEATYNGTYAVIGTYNSCKDTSLCVTVTSLAQAPTGIQKGNTLESLSVYPNPGTGIFTIESEENYLITVRSALGEKILEERSKGKSATIDLSAYPGGIYHLTIQTETSGKTMKLVKN